MSPFWPASGWGLGQVTWVAQPMSADAVPTNPTGWPYVWNHIFGWANDAYVLPGQGKSPTIAIFESSNR